MENKISKNQKIIMVQMYNGSARSDGELLYTYKSLHRETKLSFLILKRGVRGLKRIGLVQHTPAINEDGVPMGSGFMLTQNGDFLAKTFEGAEE